jgi:hypothetical protein
MKLIINATSAIKNDKPTLFAMLSLRINIEFAARQLKIEQPLLQFAGNQSLVPGPWSLIPNP